ncbi:hypothetical protein AB1Y20_018826 [Prymnesium parvum]|uniref:NAD(P)-binding domain-containing protein n=1 Tax=Prymnesium parvum TaxID=97485 RepID=A0AB34JSX7_PRYPA
MLRYASFIAAALAGALLTRCLSPSSPAPPEFASEPLARVSSRLRALAQHASSHRRRVVLVTGAAGFVGFHTALQLHAEGDAVVGLDNFNSYYDVRLKRLRAALLHRAGMRTLVEGDVCDAELLRTILREGRVSHVIHLAAQAGVRYSLKKPLAYVEANVRCFVTLLEAVHAVNNSVPIAYASSSSVYGLNTLVPFSETHRVDQQASLYGATKKSNENIAHVYHHLHKLKLTGLRFFTVYGPIGRPDMAYFGFTQERTLHAPRSPPPFALHAPHLRLMPSQAILAGRRITEFRKDNGDELQRDFTYISDIVDGVIAASRLAAPLEIFNLGNTRPEKVSTLVKCIEAGLGRKANSTRAPITAGDVPLTFADVSHARKLLRYEPKVTLEAGIRRFLLWYSDYYQVDLARDFMPSRKEAHELKVKYNINVNRRRRGRQLEYA